MKFAIALGGFLGFAIAMIAGFFAHREPARVLFEGSLAAVAGALLFRWLHRQLVAGLNDSHQQRRQARVAEAAAAATAAPAAAPRARPPKT